MNQKQIRLNQIEEEIKNVGLEGFWTGSKFAENHLRKLQQEKSQLEMEIQRDVEEVAK